MLVKKKQHYNIYILIQLFTFCAITTDNWLKSYLIFSLSYENKVQKYDKVFYCRTFLLMIMII